MMTEADAKTKWCPFSRPVMPRTEDCGFQAGNRDYDRTDGAPSGAVAIAGPLNNCIGSACMAWRWHPSLSIDNPGRAAAAGQTIKETRGYCGLAGKL